MKKELLHVLLDYTQKHGINHHTYIDRLTIYFDSRASSADLVKLESLSKKNQLTCPCQMKGYMHFDRKLELFQLDKKAIKLLQRVCSTEADYRITYIELSLDFFSKNVEKLKNLRMFFNKCLVRKRKSKNGKSYYFTPYIDEDTDYQSIPENICFDSGITFLTHYYNQKIQDKVRFALYGEDDDYRWDESYGYVHLEYRYSGLDAVKSLGIITARDLVVFDHLNYWCERLDLRHPILKELGRFKSKGESAQSLNNNGKKLFNSIVSLQAYLSFHPNHSACFEPITTETRLLNYCQLD